MDHGLSLSRTFFKAHGHGNDYLVFEEGEGWRVTPDSVRTVCDRHRGVGSDGIVVLLADEVAQSHRPGPARSRPRGPFRLRMFNPDGSEFERSGNGLRILGAYLHSTGRVAVQDPFPVEVGGDVVELAILREEPAGVLQISAEMGAAAFGLPGAGDAAGATIPRPGGPDLRVHRVSVGNPHCVVFREKLLPEELLELGPFLSAHPSFPRGTNVQLARLVGDRRVDILIWERGVGRTSSSGTSACAVAAASVREGRLSPGRVTVGMEGGSFSVVVSPNMSIRLEGPVEILCTGELSEGFLGKLE